jgi:hypothetical protein
MHPAIGGAMTTRVKRNRIGWLVMRYPEHTKYLGEAFTLAELVERFFDSASALSIISRAFLPDFDDVEQIDKALLLRLWWLGDVESSALEVVLNWLAGYRSGQFNIV